MTPQNTPGPRPGPAPVLAAETPDALLHNGTAPGDPGRRTAGDRVGELAWQVTVYEGGYWGPRDHTTVVRGYSIPTGVPADRDPFAAVVDTLSYMLTDRHKTGARETCRDHRALTVTSADGTALTAVLRDAHHDVHHDTH